MSDCLGACSLVNHLPCITVGLAKSFSAANANIPAETLGLRATCIRGSEGVGGGESGSEARVPVDTKSHRVLTCGVLEDNVSVVSANAA